MIAMRKNDPFGFRVHDPSPKEIRRVCDEIQATWSPQQRAKRQRRPRVAWWTAPMIRLSDVQEALNGERADSWPYAGGAGRDLEH